MKTGRYTQNAYPFSKFRRFMSEKLPLFLDFANSRLPLKKNPFLRESGYERGIGFDREWGAAGRSRCNGLIYAAVSGIKITLRLVSHPAGLVLSDYRIISVIRKRQHSSITRYFFTTGRHPCMCISRSTIVGSLKGRSHFIFKMLVGGITRYSLASFHA